MTHELVIKFNRYCSKWVDGELANNSLLMDLRKQFQSRFKVEGGVYIREVLRELGANRRAIVDDKAWDYYAYRGPDMKYFDIRFEKYPGSSDYKVIIPYNHYVCLVEPPETDFV